MLRNGQMEFSTLCQSRKRKNCLKLLHCVHWCLRIPKSTWYYCIEIGSTLHKDLTCQRSVLLSEQIILPHFDQCFHTLCSGGSRISQRRWRQPPRWGRQPVIWSKIFQKLHENERIWIQKGGGASLAPPLDPPMPW